MLGVVEAARTLVASGDLVYDEGAFVWRAGPRSGAQGLGMDAVLSERLGTLDADSRRVLEALDEPLLSTTLILPGEDVARTDGWAIKEDLDHQVDLVLECGEVIAQPTTVIDWSDNAPEVTRYGAGDATRFETWG